MGRRLFKFQQFSMCDEHCGMRIGTDAVLLGAWTGIPAHARRMADVGCGCGIIALMLAQKAPLAQIDAIEIDAGACDDARENFDSSPWKNRLRLYQCPFEEIRDAAPYDLIVSNPPFYTETLQSPTQARATARHAGSLSFAALAEASTTLLARSGVLAVILPAAQDEMTVLTASRFGLQPIRCCHVKNSARSAVVRTMWEFGYASEMACEKETLIVRSESGKFSHEYLQLTSDFHLKSIIEKNR